VAQVQHLHATRLARIARTVFRAEERKLVKYVHTGKEHRYEKFDMVRVSRFSVDDRAMIALAY